MAAADAIPAGVRKVNSSAVTPPSTSARASGTASLTLSMVMTATIGDCAQDRLQPSPA